VIRRSAYRWGAVLAVSDELSPSSGDPIGAVERVTTEVQEMQPSDYDDYPAGWARVRYALVDAIEARGGPPGDFPIETGVDTSPHGGIANTAEMQYALALEQQWRASRFNDTAVLKFVCDGVLTIREVEGLA
jgi:hypothetical protein